MNKKALKDEKRANALRDNLRKRKGFVKGAKEKDLDASTDKTKEN